MSNWALRFLGMAELVSTWSKDPSTKVGAVIADSSHRIISTGYNGFPRGTVDKVVPREKKLLRTIHAEVNAILFAARPLHGTTIYVTHIPCSQCAAKIVQVGISKVICWTPSEDFLFRWLADAEEAQAIFKEAGISLIFVEPNQND